MKRKYERSARTNMSNEGLECSGPECTRPAKNKGFCMAHYMQMRRYGDVKPLKLAKTIK